jgi:hypothetical protein
MKMMDRETNGAARQKRACAHGDRGVDRADPIAEAVDDSVEPAAQPGVRVKAAIQLRMRNRVRAKSQLFSDCGGAEEPVNSLR